MNSAVLFVLIFCFLHKNHLSKVIIGLGRVIYHNEAISVVI